LIGFGLFVSPDHHDFSAHYLLPRRAMRDDACMAATRRTETRPPQLIGAKPASREYGIKYTSLRDIVSRGDLPCIRIGRAMYLDRVDVEDWIAAQKQRA
jgi:hypothetical protein